MFSFTRNLFLVAFLVISLPFNLCYAQDDHEDETHESEGEQAEGAIEINAAQQAEAGVVTTEIQYQRIAEEILAPGEVIVNAYQSSQVTSRISAQITGRHARLGDSVKQNQPLVTLSSVEMAEAQGNLLISGREWERVRKLGREIVSEQRYVEAQVGYQQAQARVTAFGMTADQVQSLIAQNDVTKTAGAFDLLAPQDGTVISDNFVIGEVIEPGSVLFELTDESIIWVETSLTPEQALSIIAGTPAYVRVDEDWLEGKVVQNHHALNETTRTLGVRIEVPNPEERLHPGLFVDTRIQGNETIEALVLPEDAVLRSPDGDWAVFVEESPNRYKSVEVEIIRIVQGLAMIEGITVGTRVVTQGAFFVQSELAKSGFEVHNH